MKKLSIKLSTSQVREYPIFVGSHMIERIDTLFDFSDYSKLFIITDETVAPLYLDKLKNGLPAQTPEIILPSGESAKDIQHLTKIWQQMIAEQLDRKSLIINLGGGVIGDIGGFAASTYMRGIDFINIPTTLLAQVDESVGGKTMIDFHGIKNIVGTFYQPSAVIIDIESLKTLPKRQLLNGFAEIIKHGLIKDKQYFDLVTRKKPADFSEEELIEIISRSNEIKAEFVESDEKESGMRKIVNYGHTIGHAIEALSLQTENPLLHGEAISIGMVVENNIAVQLGLLPEEINQTVKQKLLMTGLPTKIPNFKTDKILEKIKLDKKNAHGKINFTLIKQIGEGVIDQTTQEEIIIKALNKS
jgi:3-dehydroquinate synthase